MEAFLRTNFPKDVLMPVKKGEKSPMFRHKSGAWTWASFNRVRAKHVPNNDICVILQDLCVVDVDTRELEEDMEERFPVLTWVAKERTAKGAHYWFRRSPQADRDGYYDSHGARIHGVDFKTRCSNGTGGVVVVAPSTGKTWVREPDVFNIIPIPFDLLAAVAAPTHVAVTRDFVFLDGDGEPATLTVRHLSRFSYFEPFLNDETFATEPIPVPVHRAPFELMMSLVMSGQLEDADPTPSKLLAAVRAADMLGLGSEAVRGLVAGLPFCQADMYSAWPEMWRALHAERVWRRTPPAEREGPLLREITEDVTFQPLPRHDERWLFPGAPTRHAPRTTVVQAPSSPHVLMNELPGFVRGIMQRYPVVLAGGSVLGLLTGTPSSDYDLFPIMASDEEASSMVEDVRASLGPEAIVKQTGCAVTIIVDEVICQIVLRMYNSPDEVMSGFDIAPCKAGLWVDRETGQPRLGATPSWFEGVRRWAFPVDLACWSGATVARTIKYVAKGFDAMLPGLRRGVLMQLPRRTYGRDVRGLLTAEAVIRERLVDSRRLGERISPSDVQHFLRGNQVAMSDYLPILKAANRFLWAVKSMVRNCITGECPSSTEGTCPRNLQWARFDAATAITFFPTDPRILEAFESPLYEALIESWLTS